MSNHEIAQGQKTARRVIASRRLRHSVTLVSSAPPHRADTSGYPPQHPLPTRRAGVASLISAIIPDALIGSDSARRAMEDRIAAMPWFGLFAAGVVFIDLLALAIVLGGAN